MSPRTPAHEFVWLSREGEPHQVSAMATRHLFYTLRMIWNYSAPQSLRIHPYRRYVFSPQYTPDYIAEATRAIALELYRREDRTPWMDETLGFMAAHFNERFNPLPLPEAHPREETDR